MLAQWAEERGFEFDPGLNTLTDEELKLQFLRQGQGRYSYNASRGEWKSRAAFFFDYHYQIVTQRGKKRPKITHYYLSAVAVLGPVPFKALHIRPETFADKLADFVGEGDLDFESAEFSAKFHVQAPDRKWAYDILHQRAIEFLLKNNNKKFWIEFNQNHVAVFWPKSRFSPSDFEQAADIGVGLLDLLPAYMVREQIATAPE